MTKKFSEQLILESGLSNLEALRIHVLLVVQNPISHLLYPSNFENSNTFGWLVTIHV